ncbi:MAG: hypothetical protein JW779_07555 [Candidatus Thorarchaeota archaeon]|nr:hypothetical protein [Candidatus Thorarchaeota archaeon]
MKVVTDVSFLVGDHVIIRSRWDPLLVNHSRLEIIAPAIPASLLQEEMSHIVDIDTRHLGNNATCTIKCTTWLSNGSAYTVTFDEVFIGNFFYPHVNVLAPNGGEVWTDTHSITWEAIDLNENETLLFDVLVSSDSGVTFSILASTLTTTWFEWNCSSFEEGDTYLIEVRVTDGIYFVSDRSDSPFTIGTAVITTTTITTITTTTTTTNTTNLLTDLRFIVFIVILFTSSAVMALIVYYAARKWF